jgi:hypothetical protein
MIERERSLDSVVRQYMATVRPMHLEFVEPSKRHAHVIVPEGGNNRVAMEMIASTLQAVLSKNVEDATAAGRAAAEEAAGRAAAEEAAEQVAAENAAGAARQGATP